MTDPTPVRAGELKKQPVSRHTPECVSIGLFKDGLTGGLQVSIDYDDGSGGGHGRRLLGPKFCGQSTAIKAVTISDFDVVEIRKYLNIAARIAKKRAALPKRKVNPHE